METTSPSEIQKKLEALIRWRDSYGVLFEAKQQQEREILEAKEANCAGNLIEKHCSEESVPELSKQTSGYSTDSHLDNNKKTPRKYLRRGEGIQHRFKISPDAFNLKNLPPYKYANAHPNLRKQSKIKCKRDAPKEMPTCDASKEIPIRNASKDIPVHAKLDAQEQRFQRLFFESKSVANSTPDNKSASKSELYDESQPRSSTHLSAHTTDSLINSIVWAKVLDPLNIKPIAVTELRTQTLQELDETEDEHLNLFELLEEKAKDGSFNMNSSVIRRVLSNKGIFKKSDEQDSDTIPVSNELREAPILPKVTVNVRLDTSNSECDDSGDDDKYDDGNDSIAEEEDDDDDDDDDETCDPTDVNDGASNAGGEKSNERLHVRFMENCESTMEEERTITSVQAEDTLSDMNTEVFFEHAKELLRSAMTQNKKNMSEANFTNNSQLTADDIKELAEKSKARLAELEHQIALMKENNAELMNAKRQHEMDKVAFMQQQEEALEQLNDEKVKIEMELHDERMKLEEDRRKLEEKVRMQKAGIVSAERKEIAKLKEYISNLQMKLSEKDQNHMAAQGRMRAQLRCMEKEQKDLYAEIERLKKEVKKLEKENINLSRQQNRTMLNEINAKLADIKKNTCSTEINPKTTNNNIKKTAAPKSNVKKKSEDIKEIQNKLKITKNTFKELLSDKYVDPFQEIEDSDEDYETLRQCLDDKQDVPEATSTTQTSMPIDGKSTTTTTTPTSTDKNTEKELKTDMDKDTSGEKDCLKVLTRTTITEDGGKEILYPNGTLRKDSGDGTIVRMMYFNGDVKETNVNEGTIKYYYSKTNTWHTTYLDGLEIIEFPNGQIEHRKPNGCVEIHFPNNSVKIVDPQDVDKLAEWRFNEGTILQEMRNGDRLLIFTNGQKELNTKQFKRREYPDGTTKTVFPDGSYETRYSNGRIRLKDKDGNLILDSEM